MNEVPNLKGFKVAACAERGVVSGELNRVAIFNEVATESKWEVKVQVF